MAKLFTPGSRIVVRDAEWRIKRIDHSSDGGQALTCEGLSELVLGREAVFLTKLENNIQVLAPEETKLVPDTSSNYRASRLYLDTLIRHSTPADNKLYVAHEAALDVIPYQLEPAYRALQQPRQRMLMADAVGLGKTLEAGILTSELIARGKGKRILVLAVKSMLTQFQQEFWNRFSIGLTRLDSQGLQRVRNRIPTNHNPFHYFDKAIISIDTLKQDVEYRHYLEKAYWDIIIIDEAHNVAQRNGAQGSQRSQLAQLLAQRSDTLIMLTATPHDGKPESFASLVNMLDPTAIADNSDYAAEDYRHKNLVMRRVKEDISHQLGKSFPNRHIETLYAQASPQEEALHEELAQAQFHTLASQGAWQLFRTTLTKTLFSSPAALISTVENRLKRIERQLEKGSIKEAELQADKAQLHTLKDLAENITPRTFSKYQRLVALLQPESEFGWDPTQADDRLVVFTESIATLEFLQKHLPKDCKLKSNQVAVLRGDMADKDLAAIVEAFNQKSSPIRLLICSDVASEGINLHHMSHRMVHFDIPWSLMVFQQRNGRVDRYGQTRQPLIRYFITQSQVPGIKGDERVLELLIEKDEQAQKNIGGLSEFDPAETEAAVGQFLEEENFGSKDDVENFFLNMGLEDEAQDPVAAFTPTDELSQADMLGTQPRLFNSDFEFATHALRWLEAEQKVELESEVDAQQQLIRLTAPADLRIRQRFLPREAWPENHRFVLTADIHRINQELQRVREEDSSWPTVNYLWRLHPVMQWLSERALNTFGRHTAPVVQLAELEANEHWVLLLGSFPNRRGQMYLQSWLAVQVRNGNITNTLTLEDFLAQFNLSELINRGAAIDTAPLSATLPKVINAANEHFKAERDAHDKRINEQLEAQLNELETLKERHLRQLSLDFAERRDARAKQQESNKRQDIEGIFKDYWDWLDNTQLTSEKPYIQVAAVFAGMN